ncbi:MULTISPECIES: hypothetical protein [Klebsiella pneumoniae complex]|uniref:hypothetical protein n=1 Tax=Klebsiella pneumoniae complex TaxID=3390273 RepID=UPI0007D70E2E|nr:MULTISPECIES: hypothetical protein [Klebsiella]MCX8542054.1 hypothetical protein [Klebsiella variicola]MEA4416251.1 hypothetical protein [Klebsiella pneumoniae]SBN30826.1 conserved hypothetical protein [Klebsiella pneumoniae]HBW4475367.1 hypothetical protein [Klebsiella pneumoniae]HBW4518948.1 hypothetical protein [Klebsiella pneumoniae]
MNQDDDNDAMFDINFGHNIELNKNTTTGKKILKAEIIEGLKASENKAGFNYNLPEEIDPSNLTPEQIGLIKEKINEGSDDEVELKSWLTETAELATLAANIKTSIICGIVVAVKRGIKYFK